MTLELDLVSLLVQRRLDGTGINALLESLKGPGIGL